MRDFAARLQAGGTFVRASHPRLAGQVQPPNGRRPQGRLRTAGARAGGGLPNAVVVLAGATATFGLGASTYDANGIGPRAYAAYPLRNGQSATFNVHVVQGATAIVRIDTLATTGVSDVSIAYHTGLLVRPNPSRGKVELVAEMAETGRLKIEAYDVAGRLIAQPCNGPVAVGQQVVQ